MIILARRALDQSNGAMFLNRKLIVQLSTSRFRPQPKETNISISQPPKQLMIMNAPSPSSSINYHHSTEGQQSTPQYNYSDLNYDLMTQPSSSPIVNNPNFFHPSETTNYYSPYSNDRMTPSSLKLNHIKLNKPIKTGNSN